jgi:hypothetical protein
MLKLVFNIRRRSHIEPAEPYRCSAALLEDEARFIDLPATSIFLTEEHEIISGPT